MHARHYGSPKLVSPGSEIKVQSTAGPYVGSYIGTYVVINDGD